MLLIEKAVRFGGQTIGYATTLLGARTIALHAGAKVSPSHPHTGADVIIEGPSTFTIESRTGE